jgi:hypothetical protein
MMTWLYWCRAAFLLGLVTAVCWLGFLALVHDRD